MVPLTRPRGGVLTDRLDVLGDMPGDITFVGAIGTPGPPLAERVIVLLARIATAAAPEFPPPPPPPPRKAGNGLEDIGIGCCCFAPGVDKDDDTDECMKTDWRDTAIDVDATLKSNVFLFNTVIILWHTEQQHTRTSARVKGAHQAT